MPLFPITPGLLLNPDHVSLVRFSQGRDGTHHAAVTLMGGATLRLSGPDLDRLRVLLGLADAEPQPLPPGTDPDEMIDLDQDPHNPGKLPTDEIPF